MILLLIASPFVLRIDCGPGAEAVDDAVPRRGALTLAAAVMAAGGRFYYPAAMDFHSIYAQGFARLAACTTVTALADPARNAEAILASARECHDRGVAVALFPELGLSGYAIDDLLLQDALLDAVETAMATLVEASRTLRPVLVVGAPLRHRNRLYNTALAIHRGRVLGVVPKLHLPNYREFYEHRHFASGRGTDGEAIRLGALGKVPFGPDLLFPCEDVPGLTVHVEITGCRCRRAGRPRSRARPCC